MLMLMQDQTSMDETHINIHTADMDMMLILSTVSIIPHLQSAIFLTLSGIIHCFSSSTKQQTPYDQATRPFQNWKLKPAKLRVSYISNILLICALCTNWPVEEISEIGKGTRKRLHQSASIDNSQKNTNGRWNSKTNSSVPVFDCCSSKRLPFFNTKA